MLLLVNCIWRSELLVLVIVCSYLDILSFADNFTDLIAGSDLLLLLLC